MRAPEAAGVRETPGDPLLPRGEGGHRSRRARLSLGRLTSLKRNAPISACVRYRKSTGDADGRTARRRRHEAAARSRRRARHDGDEPRPRLSRDRRFGARGSMHAQRLGPARSRPGIRRPAAVRRPDRSARRAQARRRGDLNLYRASRADGARGAGGGRACLLREAARRHARSRRAGRCGRACSEQGAAGRLYPARSSLVDALCRDRPHARQAAGHAHEPQSAIVGLVLERAQESDALDLADRRLWRALRRRDVPGHAGEAGSRARGRRAAHRRGRAGDVQLRPSAYRLRRRLGRLVRVRAGDR